MDNSSLCQDILNCIEIILAQNGETQLLTLLKLTNFSNFKKTSKIDEPLAFDHLVTEENGILKLPLTLNYHVNLSIDWGDGNIVELKNTDGLMMMYVTQEHRYEKKGLYRVKISNTTHGEKVEKSVHLGDLPNWANNIQDFITIGRIGITELDCMFLGTLFNGIIRPNWDTSMITDMSWMFYHTINFNQKIGDNWNTQNVRNASCMFYCAEKFNQEVGKYWDTRNIRDMSQMFSEAWNFDQEVGKYWNTKNVRDISEMFFNAYNFNQKIGDNWDTGNVRNMSGMFYNAYNFNQKVGDNWDTGNARKMNYMFSHATNFNQKIGENWDTRNVRDMRRMFSYATNFNQKIGENWDTRNVRNMSWMFYNAQNFNQKIGENWNTSRANIDNMLKTQIN